MSYIEKCVLLTGGLEVSFSIYADTAVCHILTGEAILWAIHGHILIEAVLYAIIQS